MLKLDLLYFLYVTRINKEKGDAKTDAVEVHVLFVNISIVSILTPFFLYFLFHLIDHDLKITFSITTAEILSFNSFLSRNSIHTSYTQLLSKKQP